DDGSWPQHQLMQSGVIAAVYGQQVLDSTFVIRVRELGVAAQGIVFIDPLWVVGVVAIGRTRTGDGDVAYAGLSTRFEDIVGAVDVDIVCLLPVLAVLQNRGQMRHLGDVVALHELAEARVSDIGLMYGKALAAAAPDVDADDV